MTKLLFLAGSARAESTNVKLAKLASEIANDHGADITLVDLNEYKMPIYDGDLETEEGLPENAKKLKALFAQSDGFFIASPEYNSSFSPLLKNTVDWISRPHEENEGSLIAFNGKIAAIGATAPGAIGGLRGLIPLRMLLGNIGVTVVPNQVAISFGFEAFDENGKLKDERQSNMLDGTIRQLVETSKKLS